MKNENTIPAVEKTLKMLRFLARTSGGASPAELTRAAGASATTGYRILQTLIRENWVEKRADGNWELVSGLSPIRSERDAVRLYILSCGQPVLDELANVTGLAAKISIRSFDEQVTILRADSPGPFSISGKVGARFPLPEGSVGAALLAGTDEAQVRALAAACAEDIPEKRDPELILRRLHECEHDGFCLNSDGGRWKLCSMSMPIRIAGGPPAAALTLLGLHDDFASSRLDALKEALFQASARLTPESKAQGKLP